MTNVEQPLPDLQDLTGFHDYYGSVQDLEAWEALRLEATASPTSEINHRKQSSTVPLHE